MSGELTPWFPADVKPTRKGDYQILPFGEARWSYWNGKKWSFFTLTQENLRGHRCDAMHSPRFEWRGLAADPSKAAK